MDEYKKYALCFAAGFLFCWFLSSYGDNGSGIQSAIKQYQQITDDQSAITRGIDNAEKSIKSMQSGIDTAARETEKLDESINESGKIIEDCKRILAAIKQRDEEKKQNH